MKRTSIALPFLLLTSCADPPKAAEAPEDVARAEVFETDSLAPDEAEFALTATSTSQDSQDSQDCPAPFLAPNHQPTWAIVSLSVFSVLRSLDSRDSRSAGRGQWAPDRRSNAWGHY